jgi:hypothetical protein
LDLVPPTRPGDVIYFNPADTEFPLGFNLLEATSARTVDLLCSDLLVSLQRLFTESWGNRMEYVLRKSLLTLLHSTGEKTLRDVPRLLTNAQYRAGVLATLHDPDLAAFWDRSCRRCRREPSIRS